MTAEVPPVYFKSPYRWARFYAYTKPHLFYSVALGLLSPVFIFAVTPLRKKFLYADHVELPISYPVPTTPRNKELTGFDDE